MIINPKYKSNNKNEGIIPLVNDPRTLYVPIGCQQCIECRKQKSNQWKSRLIEDIKTNKNGKFIGLTFSNESIAKLNSLIPKTTIKNDTEIKLEGYIRDNMIATLSIRYFLERWRKKFKKSLRHWLITELGHNGTENIHLHGIVWTNEKIEEIEKAWQYGFLLKGRTEYGRLKNWVNEQTINYMVKYVYKKDFKHKNYNSIILTSPGIGGNYTSNKIGDWTKNKYRGSATNETYRTRSGTKTNLPIYWRNKIYTEEQREQLWIQKLDKQERWILGQKIDISITEKIYYKTLIIAQEKNNKLGYGNNNKWKKGDYENQIRIIMQETRIKNAKK